MTTIRPQRPSVVLPTQRPTPPATARASAAVPVARDGFETGLGPASAPLPSEKQARDDIAGRLLPQILSQMRSDGVEPNGHNCDHAAGRTLAKLRQAGYDAQLSSTDGHVTVVVKTGGKDLIIDPTASQFFRDGSAIDGKLQKEGFVGTKEELTALVQSNLDDVLPQFVGGQVPARTGNAADDAQVRKLLTSSFMDKEYGGGARYKALEDRAMKDYELQLARQPVKP